MKCLADRTIQEFIDEELPANARRSVEEHLSECAHCRARVRDLKDSVAIVRAGLEQSNPTVLRIPEWTPSHIGANCSRFAPAAKYIARPTRFNWRQGLTAAVAAGLVVLSLFSFHHEGAVPPATVEHLLRQLPVVADDPQLMWQQGSVIITVVNYQTGVVEQIVTSQAGDRVVREPIDAHTSFKQDSTNQPRGI